MFVQHVLDQPKDGEAGKESEALPGGPSTFQGLPVLPLDDPPDIIKLPSSGSTFMLSRQPGAVTDLSYPAVRLNQHFPHQLPLKLAQNPVIHSRLL